MHNVYAISGAHKGKEHLTVLCQSGLTTLVVIHYQYEKCLSLVGLSACTRDGVICSFPYVLLAISYRFDLNNYRL